MNYNKHTVKLEFVSLITKIAQTVQTTSIQYIFVNNMRDKWNDSTNDLNVQVVMNSSTGSLQTQNQFIPIKCFNVWRNLHLLFWEHIFFTKPATTKDLCPLTIMK